ncbi:aminoglycoside phosphotransferase family protein [Actinomadura darangshiensis]|nr:aminoglycoside phosphotransferase family protein [Actinomadura darangshiensis]
MGERPSTHLLELRADVVIKRYRSWEHRQQEREWSALELLDEHASGLAPTPVSARLTADPPEVVMSRLPGRPLDGPVSSEQAGAVAAAVVRLQESIPRRVLADLPPRAGHPVELLEQVRGWCSKASSAESHPVAAKALTAGTDWAHRPGLTELLHRTDRPVFGTGDGNLSNYLWDGSEVRLVDFEYSGRSDRAYELAEAIEHISAREDGGVDLAAAFEQVELEASEAARSRECRRLLALFWLLRILGTRPDRSPVLIRQAERLLSLL